MTVIVCNATVRRSLSCQSRMYDDASSPSTEKEIDPLMYGPGVMVTSNQVCVGVKVNVLGLAVNSTEVRSTMIESVGTGSTKMVYGTGTPATKEGDAVAATKPIFRRPTVIKFYRKS